MGLDEGVAQALAQPPWDALLPVAAVLYYVGSTPGWCLLVLGLAATRRWALAVPLTLALLAGDALSFGLKELVARPRPDGALLAGSDFSFPSGHALRAALLPAVLAVQRPPRAWVAGTAMFAVLVAFSRLVAHAHYLTDVLAGLALGSLVGSLVATAWTEDWRQVRSRVQTAAGR